MSLPALEERTMRVLGTRFTAMGSDELIDYLVGAAKRPAQTVIAHVNAHALNLAYESPSFRDFLNRADLAYCDGFGALVGARVAGYRPMREHRATCPDFLEDLARRARDAGVSLFLLGGRAGVAEEAARRLCLAAPGLRVASHHGHFAKQGVDNDAVVEVVNAFGPDLLLVGFGMPLQEEWIRDNRDRTRARAFLTIGACLDFYSGRVARGPRWLTDRGLEWVTRLVVEPRRLWERYLLGNPVFLLRVMRERLRG